MPVQLFTRAHAWLRGSRRRWRKRKKLARRRLHRIARFRGRYSWLVLIDRMTRSDVPRDRIIRSVAQREIDEARGLIRRLGAKETKTKGSRLKHAQAELLARMRADNEAAGPPFAPTEYWREVNARFDAWFRDEGIKDVGRQGFNAFFSTPEPGNRKYHRYAMYMLYRAVAERDDRGLLDALSASGKHSMTFGEHAVSWDLLISLDTLFTVRELVPDLLDEPVVVADLGSGWGRIGHVLLHANPAAAYVALDLPESLLVAEQSLPGRLPAGTPVTGYDATRGGAHLTRAALLESGGAFFYGPQALADFEPQSIDVLVNVASFQEMTLSQVTAYIGLADVAARHVFLQERWIKPAGLPADVIAGRDAYPIPARWAQRFERSSCFSDLFFEAGYATRS